MKRTVLYSAIAVGLGILLTLIPLLALPQFGIDSTSGYTLPEALPQRLKTLEGRGPQARVSTDVEVGIFAVSFFVALAVYVFTRRRRPSRVYRMLGPFPY